ncbi:hypothetical protein FQN57_002129 [Myotisia sp. PD_48]|nr:hypothetical protein FQN57_002129 [Myotisia sp. PD_48]
MALLQNEDFTIWQLRTAYLSTIKDGIGDRLINVNSSVLNSPGFRSAGWSATSNANAAHIKRTHSPPIPTGALAPGLSHANSISRKDGDGTNEDRVPAGLGFGIDDEEVGEDREGPLMAGGSAGDKKGLSLMDRRFPEKKKTRTDFGQKHRRRNARRPSIPGDTVEEDSSDLSDESDEETARQRAVQQIQFTKIPIRQRAGSSPIRASNQKGPRVFITSPSVRSVDNRFRRSSLGAVGPTKTRARGDTITSSELSSDIELDPEMMKKRQIHFAKQEEIIMLQEDAESEKLEEEVEIERTIADGARRRDEESIAGSVGSALSSDFGATAGSGSLLARVGIEGALGSSSPLIMNKMRRPTGPKTDSSPKKNKESTSILQTLPPPQPISTIAIEPVSLLSNMLNARKTTPANPMEKYAALSGKGSSGPQLYVKLYVPGSNQPEDPIDMPLNRYMKDGDQQRSATVAEAIGLALWRYMEDGLKPRIEGDKRCANRWNLRLVEDGEVDYDFPPLARKSAMVDFTSNNNRAAANRGRSRSKPYDEFALVEATQKEFEENEALCPQDSMAAVNDTETATSATPTITNQVKTGTGRTNPILGLPFSTALNDSSLTPADLPAVPTSHSTPRMGVSRQLKVRYLDLEGSRRITTMNTSTDSYIAEILDSVCKKWGLDRGNFLLKVLGSNTIAPLDRTVEALGTIVELDLVRRRFGAGPLSLTGSPGSSSPNAPLLVDNPTNGQSGKKGKKGGVRMLHPLAQKQDVFGSYYKKYHVIRKQSMSFTTSSQRVLAFDHDYMHIMPADTGRTLFESNTKTTSVLFSDVVGSKVSRRHPKSFRVVVLRGNEANEQKRYDFEAKTALEASEIVDEIKKNMMQHRI